MLPLSRLLAASTGYLCLHASLFAAPNIVFILVDDLGWTDLSTGKTNKNNQSLYYQTPNIDALAADGVCFPNCYTQQNCEPARAALITGQYPARPKNGVYNVDSLDRGNDPNSPIMAAPQRVDVNPAGTSLFETLKTVGYHIGWFGKNHGTGEAADLGVNHGVDTNYASSKQTVGIEDGVEIERAYLAIEVDGPSGPNDHWAFDIPVFTTDGFAEPYSAAYDTNVLGPVANGNDVALNEGKKKHHVDAVTDEAVKFIATRVATAPSVPFMLYYPITGVHTDHVSRHDLKVKYVNLGDSDDRRHTDPEYAGLVETVDQSIGRLMNALEDPNGDGNFGDSIVNNTVIVFTSDNGSPADSSDSDPLKGEKGMLDEGGIRVPLIMKWPGHTGNKKGKVSQQLVHLVDMYPTLAAIAGATLPNPETYPLDGVSLTPVLDGGDPNNLPIITRNLYWHFPGYMDNRGWPRSVVQETVGTKNYKLIYNYADALYELYNLTDDIGEQTNIVGSKPAIANQLAGHLNTWLSDLSAKTGTYRATGATVSYPPVPITSTDPNRPPANTHGAALRFAAYAIGADEYFNPFFPPAYPENDGFSSLLIGSTLRVSKAVVLNHWNFPALPAGQKVEFTVTFDVVPSTGTLVDRTENGVGLNAGGGDETPYHIDNTGTSESVRLKNLSISNVAFTPAWIGASVSLPRFGLYRPGGKVTGTIILSGDNSLLTTGDNQTESIPTDNFDNEVLISGIPVADTLTLFPGVAGSKFTLRGLEIDYKVVLP